MVSGCALLYGFSLSLLASSMVCLSPNTVTKSDTQNSANSTQSNSMKADPNQRLHPFSERHMSRQRSVEEDIGLDTEDLDHIFVDFTNVNTSSTGLDSLPGYAQNAMSVKNQSCACESGWDVGPCYEMRSSGLSSQTLLYEKFTQAIWRNMLNVRCNPPLFDPDKVLPCDCDILKIKNEVEFNIWSKSMKGSIPWKETLSFRPSLFGMAVM